MNIVIVGAGPRSLAIALDLVRQGARPTIIDPAPIHTWQAPNIIPDIQMRSPVTFDLVTFRKELQNFSLTSFLGKDIPYTNSQREVEQCEIPVSRRQFCEYLQHTWEYVSAGSNFIQEKVISIKESSVVTETQEIAADKVIIATGYTSTLEKMPTWIAETVLRDKIIPLPALIENLPVNQKIAVVGSGQGAAEVVYLLASHLNTVYWCVNHETRVHQYPAPPYSEWKSLTALGPYYRTLKNSDDQINYLNKVKQWQPTITPYIAEKLKEVAGKFTQIFPTSSNNLEDIFKQLDHIVILSGNIPDINLVPFDREIQTNPYIPNFPLLDKGFKIPETNVYFTGLLATTYDGPRQASLISAGITAQEIIQDILDR